MSNPPRTRPRSADFPVCGWGGLSSPPHFKDSLREISFRRILFMNREGDWKVAPNSRLESLLYGVAQTFQSGRFTGAPREFFRGIPSLERILFPALLAILLVCSTAPVSAQQRQTGGTGARPTTGGFSGAGRGTGEYPRSTDVGEAMISVDPETRKIVIIADDDTNLQVKNVIESLDRPKPQVLIKVVFLQVTLGNDLDFGVEASYTHRAG